MRIPILLATLGLAILAPAKLLRAASQPHPFAQEDFFALQRIADPQISPDGSQVAYSIRTQRPGKNAMVSQIWVTSLRQPDPKPITTHEKGATRPRWSPDGTRIAYLSSRSGSQQIWIQSAKGGEPRQLTHISTGADNHQWVAHGNQVVFTSDVWPNLPPGDAAQASHQKDLDESGVQAQVIDGLLFRHWNEFRNGKRSHVFVVDSKGGDATDLTPGDSEAPPFSLGGPDGFVASPDGRFLAFTRSPLNPGTQSSRDVEAWSTDANIWFVPLSGGEAKPLTARNKGWDGSPVWSPDGRHLAYRSQARDGYEADTFRLAILRFDPANPNPEPAYLDSSFDRSVDDILWTPDGRELWITVEESGSSAVYRVTIQDGKPVGSPQPLISGAHLADVSLDAGGGTLVATRDSLIHPAEIVTASTSSIRSSGLKALQTVTHHNDALLASVTMPAARTITYPGANNAPIQAWLLTPPTQTQPQPKNRGFLLFIHGGPQSAWRDAFSYRWCSALFAAHGYTCLQPNPRGSTGFGQTFTEQISGDWGGACYTDLMNGVDWAIQSGLADPDHLGALGGSFGGYMVNWILGHTNRFKALVSHAGVFNLESKYGSTEELWFPEWDLQGKPWDHSGSYTRFSPHRFARQFKTPTLVIHGQLDYRVPVEQGFQLFTTLKRLGVETRLLHYPDEGHWILKPRNSRLWYDTTLDWLDRHVAVSTQ